MINARLARELSWRVAFSSTNRFSFCAAITQRSFASGKKTSGTPIGPEAVKLFEQYSARRSQIINAEVQRLKRAHDTESPATPTAEEKIRKAAAFSVTFETQPPASNANENEPSASAQAAQEGDAADSTVSQGWTVVDTSKPPKPKRKDRWDPSRYFVVDRP